LALTAGRKAISLLLLRRRRLTSVVLQATLEPGSCVAPVDRPVLPLLDCGT
jgi:hypothetical protein